MMSDGNEPIFSEVEPDSSLETSRPSFYHSFHFTKKWQWAIKIYLLI